MPQALTQEVLDLLTGDDTRAVLSFIDAKGVVRIGLAKYLLPGTDGQLHYLAVNESSPLHHGMVRGIWFDSPLSVALLGGDGQFVAFQARPVKVLLAGPVFLDHYRRLRDTTGEDLACLWLLEPGDIGIGNTQEEGTPRVGAYEVLHLDRIARKPES